VPHEPERRARALEVRAVHPDDAQGGGTGEHGFRYGGDRVVADVQEVEGRLDGEHRRVQRADVRVLPGHGMSWFYKVSKNEGCQKRVTPNQSK